jgi:hypothetical protein
MLRFKPEVRIGFFQSVLGDVLRQACTWSLKARVDVEVNSINDGQAVHMKDSLHGFDLAIDLDTVGDRRADTEELADYLRRVLHPQYDVVFEGDHVHVEWDARRGPLRRAAG